MIVGASVYAYAGGLTGSNQGEIINCYYYDGLIVIINGTVQTSNALGNPCTAAQLGNPSFFTGTLGWSTAVWDFTGIDFERKVYPRLK